MSVSAPARPARASAFAWWRPILLLDVVLLAITVVAVAVSSRSEFLRAFHLGIETNPATWWEATQLLVFALFMRSAADSVRERDRAAARACTILALVAAALFADELGSLHERLGMFFVVKHVPREAPFALLVMSGLAYGLVVLDRRRAMVRDAARLIAAGFGFFVLAGVQEIIEHRFVDTPAMDAVRTAIEEGSELIGTFLLLLAGVRARRAVSREPLGSMADWKSLGFFVILALILSGPVLIARAGWTFEQLRIPKLGDFGVVIPIAVFTCGAAAAALQGLSQRPVAGAWWRLAVVLIGLSIAAETHLHRHVIGYVHWRYDLDLIAGFPLLAWALLSIPELRRPPVYLGLGALAVMVPLSVFAVESPIFSFINLHLAAFGSATAVLFAGPATVTQFTTVNRRTVVVPEATTRSR